MFCSVYSRLLSSVVSTSYKETRVLVGGLKTLFKKQTFSNVSGDKDVLFEKSNNKGVITLNRPQKLNALNSTIVTEVTAQLQVWQNEVSAVIIRSSSDKAFCAGGDIVDTCKIPVVALIHGLTIGAGVRLSLHVKYRVATEKTLLALPDTRLGIIPDMGCTYFLPRLKNNLGMFLGLTGERLLGYDLVRADIATHFCDSDKLGELEKELLQLDSVCGIGDVLNKYMKMSKLWNTKDSMLTLYWDKIERLFSTSNVEEILSNLDYDGSAWALRHAKTIRTMSPTSLKLTARMVNEGINYDMKQSMFREFNVLQHIVSNNDFYEGVRSFIHVGFKTLYKKHTVCNFYGSVSDKDIVFEKLNNKGVITLNRPQKLNSFTFEMMKEYVSHLQVWQDEVSFVIVRSSSNKAFCAGGDVVAVAKLGQQNVNLAMETFLCDYKMNYLTHTYKIPQVALIHGITIGAYMALHGKYRVATEKTLFSILEPRIGLIPDLGGTYFLSRLKNNLGMFLSLTGERLQGYDLVRAEIATHFCDSDKLRDLEKELLALEDGSGIDEVLNKYTKMSKLLNTNQSVLTPSLDKIERLFSTSNVEEIVSNLDHDGSAWALRQAKTIRKMSPTSLKLTARMLSEGINYDMMQTLIREFNVVQHILGNSDFYEGVRSLLIDKDNMPLWNPSSVEDVTDAIVDSYFVPAELSLEL